MCCWGTVHACEGGGAPGGQGRTSALVDLDLQVALSDPTWVLGTALWILYKSNACFELLSSFSSPWFVLNGRTKRLCVLNTELTGAPVLP